MNQSEPKINERVLKVTGSLNLENGIEIDQDYSAMIVVSCYSKGLSSNHDGTYNMIYRVKCTGAGSIIDSKGATHKLKGKGSYSQRWRMFVEDNDSYDEIMTKILRHPNEVLDFIRTLS